MSTELPSQKIIYVTGVNGGGKTTLVKDLVGQYPDHFKELVSTTDRDIRLKKGEKDGVTYNFVTTEEFLKREMIQTSFIGGKNYGLELAEVQSKSDAGFLLLIVAPTGIPQIENYINENGLGYDREIIYMRPSDETIMDNLKKDGFSDEEIQARVSRGELEKDFNKLRESIDMPIIEINTLDKHTTGGIVANLLQDEEDPEMSSPSMQMMSQDMDKKAFRILIDNEYDVHVTVMLWDDPMGYVVDYVLDDIDGDYPEEVLKSLFDRLSDDGDALEDLYKENGVSNGWFTVKQVFNKHNNKEKGKQMGTKSLLYFERNSEEHPCQISVDGLSEVDKRKAHQLLGEYVKKQFDDSGYDFIQHHELKDGALEKIIERSKNTFGLHGSNISTEILPLLDIEIESYGEKFLIEVTPMVVTDITEGATMVDFSMNYGIHLVNDGGVVVDVHAEERLIGLNKRELTNAEENYSDIVKIIDQTLEEYIDFFRSTFATASEFMENHINDINKFSPDSVRERNAKKREGSKATDENKCRAKV